jgi:hypothetical protein
MLWQIAGLAALAFGCVVQTMGEGKASEPLPPNVTACAFDAMTNDPDPAGLNMREAPRAKAPVLGRLPPVESNDAAMGKILPEFHVIGTRDGWFLIEGAHYDPGYDLPKNKPKLYAGRGWVAGNFIGSGLRTPTLKQAPNADAADVVALSGEADGGAFDASSISVHAILGCSGAWFRVEVPLKADGHPLQPKLTTDAPKDFVRGWTTGFCTLQLTTCN